MAQISNSTRENLVSNNYLHSTKWNFYNAAMGGQDYATIVDRGIENTKAYKNILMLKERVEIIYKSLRKNEEKFYKLAGVRDANEFTQRNFMADSNRMNKVISETTNQDELAKEIAHEAILIFTQREVTTQYLMGIDSEAMSKRIVQILQKKDYGISDEKVLDVISSNIIDKGLTNDILKSIEKSLGNQKFIEFLVKEKAGSRKNSAPLTTRKLRGAQKDFYSESSIESIKKDIIKAFGEEYQKKINKTKNPQNNNLYISYLRKEVHNIIQQYGFDNPQGVLTRKAMNYIKEYLPLIFGKLDAKKFFEAQVTDNSSVSIGYNGEFLLQSFNLIDHANEYVTNAIVENVGALKTPKKLNVYKREMKGDGKKHTTTSQSNLNTNRKTGIAEKTTSGGDIRQDGIVTFIGRDGKKYKFGFQVKQSYNNNTTIHFQSPIKLNTLLATMEQYKAIGADERNEILYMLTNYYYFRGVFGQESKQKNTPKDSDLKGVRRGGADSTNYTAQTSATIRYINLLLTMGIELILEPELEKGLEKNIGLYTGNRMEYINQQLKTPEVAKKNGIDPDSGEEPPLIVGNSFYVISGHLVPVSSFFGGILDLINQYKDLIEKKEKSNTYFIFSPFHLKDYKMPDKDVEAIQEEKLETLTEEDKLNNEWRYPDAMVKIGRQYGRAFIENARLSEWQMVVELDQLNNKIEEMGRKYD